MCHMSGVPCQVPGVMCQVSRFRCHVSGVTCQVSRVMLHMSPFFKVVELAGGGSVINGPTSFSIVLEGPSFR